MKNRAAGGIHRPWRTVLVLLALGVLTAALYLNTVDAPFVFDDEYQVVENMSIRSPSEIGSLLRHDMSRPLVNVSYAFDYARSRLDPSAYHITNVALHMLNVCLLYFVAAAAAADWRRSSGSLTFSPPIVASSAAILFAVHPLMTEAVAFVSSRSEVLCGAFFLGGVLAGRWALLQPNPMRIALVWLLLVLAVGSKELGVMLPAVLWLYDRWILSATMGDRRNRLWRVHLPMIGLIGVVAVARLWFVAHEYGSQIRFSWRSAVLEAELLGLYARLFVWPSGLTLIHQIDPLRSLLTPRAILAVATFIVVAAVPVALQRAHRLLAFGTAWFLLLLLPSAGLVVLVERAQLFAEHRAYLPGVGLFICAGIAAEALWRRYPRRRPVAIVAGAALVAALAGATVNRNERWRHPMLLWGDTVRKAPHTFAAQYGYARALQNDGDYARAAEYHRRAIAIKPNDEGPYQNLAVCLIEQGQREAAAAVLAQVKRLAPETVPTQQAIVFYAAAFGTAGDLRAACADLDRVAARTRRRPSDAVATSPHCRAIRR